MKTRFFYVFLLVICKNTRASEGLDIASPTAKDEYDQDEYEQLTFTPFPPYISAGPIETLMQFTRYESQFTMEMLTIRYTGGFQKVSPEVLTKDDSNSTKPSVKQMGSSQEDFLQGIASTNAILAFTSLPLNIFVIKHFSNRGHISAILYHKNGLMDLMCGLGFLLQVPPIFDIMGTRVPMALILLSYVVTTVAVRGSTFTNLVLSSVRCINILSPFFRVKKRAIAISIIAYLAIWTSIAGYDVYTFASLSNAGNNINRYVYAVKTLDLKPELGFGLRTKIFGNGIIAYGNLAIYYYGIPVLLPCILSVVLMALQLWSLLKQSRFTLGGAEKNKAAENAKGSAMTILILTLIYITTSLLSIIAWLAVYRDELMVTEFRALNYTELGIVYISTSTCPLLCSTLSPLTLLIRGAGFRTAVKRWVGLDRGNISSVRTFTDTKVSEIAV